MYNITHFFGWFLCCKCAHLHHSIWDLVAPLLLASSLACTEKTQGTEKDSNYEQKLCGTSRSVVATCTAKKKAMGINDCLGRVVLCRPTMCQCKRSTKIFLLYHFCCYMSVLLECCRLPAGKHSFLSTMRYVCSRKNNLFIIIIYNIFVMIHEQNIRDSSVSSRFTNPNTRVGG